MKRMKTFLLLVIAIIPVCFLCGCCESDVGATISYVPPENAMETVCITNDPGLPGFIWTKIYTGRVVEVTFRTRSPDIIVFEDGCMISINNAEDHSLMIGEIQQVMVNNCNTW